MTDRTHLRIAYSDKPTLFGAAGNTEIMTAGDGGLDHFVDTFRAMLVAVGYHPTTAARLIMLGSDCVEPAIDAKAVSHE